MNESVKDFTIVEIHQFWTLKENKKVEHLLKKYETTFSSLSLIIKPYYFLLFLQTLQHKNMKLWIFITIMCLIGTSSGQSSCFTCIQKIRDAKEHFARLICDFLTGRIRQDINVEVSRWYKSSSLTVIDKNGGSINLRDHVITKFIGSSIQESIILMEMKS